MRNYLIIAGLLCTWCEQVAVGANGIVGDADGTRFTATLALENAELWTSVVQHRFTDELAGTRNLEASHASPRHMLRRVPLRPQPVLSISTSCAAILSVSEASAQTWSRHRSSLCFPLMSVEDHRFLDAFVVLLSSMIAAARSLSDRIPGAQFLALITGKENTYFERSFSALGVTAQQRDSTPNATATSGFIELMREAAYPRSS